MPITLKTKEEIEILAEAGRRLGAVLSRVRDEIRPGVSTLELDALAEQLIREKGDTPAFLHYQPEGAAFAYPASLCVSVNDEVVHGIPTGRIIAEGDLVSIDLGLRHRGLYVDSAITVPVGDISAREQELLQVTEESLLRGIEAARPGNHVGDISYAIESAVKPHNFGIIKILSGHGVGHAIHEDPFIPNFGRSGEGEELIAGMVIAIEPMITLGDHKVYLDKDGYTFKTKDGSKAAHFEHTVAITENGPVILTAREK